MLGFLRPFLTNRSCINNESTGILNVENPTRIEVAGNHVVQQYAGQAACLHDTRQDFARNGAKSFVIRCENGQVLVRVSDRFQDRGASAARNGPCQVYSGT